MHRIEQDIPYQSINQIFFEPDLRYQLTSNIRYDRYRISETPQQFVNLLGPDVRFVTHPGVTYNIAKKFIEAQNKSSNPLTHDEKFALLTASIVHDWGELKLGELGHGDKTFEVHDDVDVNNERIVFERITDRVIDLSDKDFIRDVYNNIAQDKDSRLGKMFNAIERIGYLQTALNSFRGEKGKRIKNWVGLTGNVLSNQIILLLEYAEEYPYVRTVLKENKSVISDLFNIIPKKRNLIARDGVISYKRSKFRENKRAWKLST